MAPVLLVKKEVAESKEATGIWRPGTKCATVVQENRGVSGWQKQGLLGSVKGRLGRTGVRSRGKGAAFSDPRILVVQA